MHSRTHRDDEWKREGHISSEDVPCHDVQQLYDSHCVMYQLQGPELPIASLIPACGHVKMQTLCQMHLWICVDVINQ